MEIGRGSVVGYTIVDTPLGAMALAAGDSGIRAVLFGDPATLLGALSAECPDAQLTRADQALAPVAAAIGAAIQGRVVDDVALDLRGTDFQKQVWKALCEIPSGTTVTYAQLAERIGRPSAVRAVASAVAANHVAVLVPCHRVIRTGGALGGYRWGLDRKRALLEAERS
jgi:AraC family transcriptional regulator of adaptative response/methylated-DNA-[protein]-cysteine methyltransferase